MAYCRYCGHANPADSTFCQSCGRSLTGTTTTTPTATPSQPANTTTVIMPPAGTTTAATTPAHNTAETVRRPVEEDTHIGIGVGRHPMEMMWYIVAGGAILLLILLLVYWKFYL
jgi:uncharacterized membrane protein YvbJ